jgi:hypothetical protein
VKPAIGYHSVHLDPETAELREHWINGRSKAFVWDVNGHSTLPPEYRPCDILYTDLPWRSGYDRYLDRAGVLIRPSWESFMESVSGLIRGWWRPAVIVTGVHARDHLPPAAQELPVRMPVAGRQQAVAYIYNAGFTPDWDDTDQLLDYLAARFHYVGDFCAGYGWAPRAFTRFGGSFVASDINPLCIGYIAAHAEEWRPDGPR